MIDIFKALIVHKNDDFTVEVNDLTLADLPNGDVLVKVAYSSINYKDSLATHSKW